MMTVAADSPRPVCPRSGVSSFESAAMIHLSDPNRNWIFAPLEVAVSAAAVVVFERNHCCYYCYYSY
jgi:hypothetical protein